MELDVTQLVVAILGLLGIGGAATEGTRRMIRRGSRRSTEDREDPAESVISRSEAVALAASEARLVRIEAKLDQVIDGQRQHTADDERRFGKLEAEIQTVRHNLRDAVAPMPLVAARVDRLEDDLRITRRQLDLDSQVRDVRRPR